MTPRLALSDLPAKLDLIIIGGGITGAGILREAVRTGAKVLLVEQFDFASGTSSGSSKLVHGGLRYLKSGQWRLTLESVRERERLLHDAAGLVEPQPFLMPLYRGAKPGQLAIRLGLWIYDRMAGAARSRWLGAEDVLRLEPQLRRENLLGAMAYEDARTDDARLVLRLILEAASEGALARNYTRAASLLRTNDRVRGVALRDELSGDIREIEAAVVVNATGAWAGELAGAPPGAPRLRPLRGSHLVFPLRKLPVGRAVSWLHPRDRRPIFVYPWEGAVVYGTTDLDHGAAGLAHPRIGAAEAQYLLDGLAHQFPELRLSLKDALSCYSGVRPVVASGKADPSAESRESAMWSSPGLVGVTGGKLTTFRVTALEVLREAAQQCPQLRPVGDQPVFTAVPELTQAPRLRGRLGAAASAYLRDMPQVEQVPLTHAPYALAELRWAARHEHVVHLDDLLMRRTRLALVMPGGGEALLPRLRGICQTELGWDDVRWEAEELRYRELWRRCHSPEGLT